MLLNNSVSENHSLLKRTQTYTSKDLFSMKTVRIFNEQEIRRAALKHTMQNKTMTLWTWSWFPHER